MVELRRYLGLLAFQLRSAALLSLQYRLDFFIQTAMVVFWSAIALLPLLVLFDMRDQVAGFDRNEALLVAGFFITLKGVLLGVIQPSLTFVVEHIRTGTLDFLLLKPADAQFMLSTSKLDLPRLTDAFTGFALAGWAAAQLARPPTFAEGLLALALLGCGALILYAIYVFVISLSFRVVKVDNLSFLIGSAFDAGRFPASIFRGALSIVFTFVLPLALMTTYPALALRGLIGAREVATSVGVTLVFLVASRRVWLASIRHYTGAGG